MIASTLPMLALLRVPWGWGRAWSFTSPVGADGVENSASPDGHAADGELAAAKHAASIGSSAGGFHHCRRIVVHGIVKHNFLVARTFHDGAAANYIGAAVDTHTGVRLRHT